MKRDRIAGIVVVMGMLSIGAVNAAAANQCCDTVKCADNEALQRTTRETSSLSGALKAKEQELRGLYAYEGTDIRIADALEAEIRGLKRDISVAAEKNGIALCCVK
jgi:hypothetical protein